MTASRLHEGIASKGIKTIHGRDWEDYVKEMAMRMEKMLGDPGTLTSLLVIKQNLVVAYASASTVDIDADVLSVEGILFKSVNLTVALDAGTGANKLDAGSPANSTWYAVHVIAQTDGEGVAGLLSLSATAPTLPSGYSWHRRVGWVLNDGSGDLYAWYHIGDWWYWNEDRSSAVFRLVSAGDATTFTDVDCSGVVPSTSTLVRVGAQVTSATNGVAAIYVRPNGSQWSTEVGSRAAYLAIYNTETNHGVSQFDCPTDGSQVIEYRVHSSDDDGFLEVVAYYDPS